MDQNKLNDETIRSLISLNCNLDDNDEIVSYKLSDVTDEVYLGNDKWEIIDELHILVDLKDGRQAQLVFRPHSIFIPSSAKQ